MKKYIFLLNAVELLKKIATEKRAEGVLFIDTETGRLTFKAYNRVSKKRRPDRVLRELEHGWLKESPTRFKFYSSVKKVIGSRLVSVAMHRDLKDAMSKLEVDELLKTEYRLKTE